MNPGVTIDAAAQRDARRGSKWSEAEPTRTCWWSPTRRSTTTRGPRNETPSPAPPDLSRPRTPSRLQKAAPHHHPILINAKKSRKKSPPKKKKTHWRGHLRPRRRHQPWSRRRTWSKIISTTQNSTIKGSHTATSPHCRRTTLATPKTASSPI